MQNANRMNIDAPECIDTIAFDGNELIANEVMGPSSEIEQRKHNVRNSLKHNDCQFPIKKPKESISTICNRNWNEVGSSSDDYAGVRSVRKSRERW